MMGDRLFSAFPVLYSDGVAERSPSLLKENPVAPVTPSAGNVEAMRLPVGHSQPSVHIVPPASQLHAENNNEHTLSDVNPSPKDLEDSSWTTVKRRRAHSLDSNDLARGSLSGNSGPRGLSKDQVQTVKATAETLSKSQKDLLNKRSKKMTHHRENSSPS